MLDHQTRLALCRLVRTRFRGRADLERAASRGEELALVELEVRLGLADESRLDEARLAAAARRWNCAEMIGYLLCPTDHRARRAMAARRYATASETKRTWERIWIARALAPDECAEVDAKRAERTRRRKLRDKLAERPPRYAEYVVVRRRAREAYERARLRSTTHGRTVYVGVVGPGCEGAYSSTDRCRPSELGLPSSYARKAYWVTTSHHTIYASREILRPEVQALTEPGYLYLSPTVRVRNGRGTELVVERLNEKGAWR
jgi:hypothetical protein